MRQTLYFSALFICMLFCQCTKIETENVPEKINIVFSNTPEVKSTVTDAIGSLLFTWKSGDKVYAYDGSNYLGSLTLKSVDAGHEFGSFEGSINPPSGSSISFIHFGESVVVSGDGSAAVNFYSQAGTLDWLGSNLIATCTLSYSPGQTVFAGKFSVPYAIGKFGFQGIDFPEGKRMIHIKGLYQSISVSGNGVLTYNEPSGTLCSEIQYEAAKIYYIALPAGKSDHNSLTFWNTDENESKTFSDNICNGIYYHAASGEKISVELN